MRLKNEAIGNGLQLVLETYGMDVPSSCTIVIIAGENIKHSCISTKKNELRIELRKIRFSFCYVCILILNDSVK